MDFSQELQELNSLSKLDQYCYRYYLQTGKYLENVGKQEIYDMLRIGIPFDKLEQEISVEEVLSSGDYTKLDIVLSKERLMFADEMDVVIGTVMRYFHTIEHSHDYFEFQCVLSGQAVHESTKRSITLQQGDIVLVPPKIKHSVTVCEDGTVLTVGIRSSTFQTAFRDVIERDFPISRFFQSALFCKEGSELLFRNSIDSFSLELLLMMYYQQRHNAVYLNEINVHLTNALIHHISGNSPSQRLFDRSPIQEKRELEIELYILNHYQTITLHQLANHFCLSEPYLSKLLKEYWGCSFSEIIQRIRIEKAKEILRSTTLRLSDICTMVGYENESYFISLFRKHTGLSPGQFRKKYHDIT